MFRDFENKCAEYCQCYCCDVIMDSVSPVVTSLWRLIYLLQEDEKKRIRSQATVDNQEISNQFFLDDMSSKEYMSYSHENIMSNIELMNADDATFREHCDEKNVFPGNSSQREPQERTSRSVGSSLINPGLEKSSSFDSSIKILPSVKLRRAPSAPISQNTSQITSLKTAFSGYNSLPAKEIPASRKQGWLVDRLRGKQVWCVVSRSRLYIFENDTSQTTKQIIYLPGCNLHHFQTNPVNPEVNAQNGVARHFSSRLLTTDEYKFQFILEISSSKQKLMFGASTRTELTEWMDALSDACDSHTKSLSLPSRNKHEITDNKNIDIKLTEKRMHSDERAKQNDFLNSNGPILTRKQTHSANISLSLSSLKNPKSNRIVENPSMNKQSHENSKPSPVKGNHDIQESKRAINDSSKDGSRGSRPFFKVMSPLNAIFSRGKRWVSVEDVRTKSKLKKTHSIAIDSTSISSTSLTDIYSSVHSDLNKTYPATKSSLVDSNADKTSQDLNFDRSQTLDTSRNSTGPGRFGVNIRRVASDLKGKLFNSSSQTGAGNYQFNKIKLKDLKDISSSGWLLFRQDGVRFTKMHCVLSRGSLYGFRSVSREEEAEVAIALNKSTVTYMSAARGCVDDLLTCRIAQPNFSNIFLQADDQGSLMNWIMAMQLESAKILMDETASFEMREVKHSSNDNLINKMQSTFSQAEFHEKQRHRHWCPNVDNYKPNDEKLTDFSNKTTSPVKSKKDFNETTNSSEYTSDLNCSQTPPNLVPNFMGMNVSVDEMDALIEPNQDIDKTPDKYHSNTIQAPFQHSDKCLKSDAELKQIDGISKTDFNMGNSDLDAVKGSAPNLQSSNSNFVFTNVKQIAANDVTSIKRSLSLGRTHVQQNIVDNDKKVDAVMGVSFDSGVATIENEVTDSITHFKNADLHNSNSANQNGLVSSLKTNHPITKQKSLEVDQSLANQKPFRFNSNVHDDVLKETWSTREDFLLGIIKDKLRVRETREAIDIQNNRGRNVVCIVNDQWNATGASEICLPVNEEKTMTTWPSYDFMVGCKSEGIGQILFDNQDQVINNKESNKRALREGFLEILGLDSKYQRNWCVLSNNCLCCYPTHDDNEPSVVIYLSGYELTLNQNLTQAKQSVINLKHASKPPVSLCASTTEECQEWYESIKVVLDNLNNSAIKQGPLVQTVKEKLLAEVLRQKQELEKLHATRAGSNKEKWAPRKERSISPVLSTSTLSTSLPCTSTFSKFVPGTSTSDTVVVSDEDKTCLLTRLTQRRMSTQIKLNAVQRQLENASFSSKDKKLIFQIGKKKPDLVLGHSEIDSQRPDLEMQARLLSSKLKELDSCLLSHSVDSPIIQPKLRNRSERHSYDQALLKQIQQEAESTKETNEREKSITSKQKDKEKIKEVNRNIKTSVQKFAHRTFAKANWYLNKKSFNQAEGKSFYKNSNSNSLSDVTPDVIDGTSYKQVDQLLYGQDFPEFAEKFRNEEFLKNGTKSGNTKTGSNSKLVDFNMSKNTSPSLVTTLDTPGCRIQSSASSPILSKLATTPETEVLQTLGSTYGFPGEKDLEYQQSKSLSASMRSVNLGTSGGLAQKRQVSATTLAEIEAFEELSMKFLASNSSTK